MRHDRSDIFSALAEGDPQKVTALMAAGVDIRYRYSGGYDALIDAVHGRDISRDPRLLELLELLIDSGVELSGITAYRESALRVLSAAGRFDAVRLLLDAGADREHLGWTPLIEAVALGSLADVNAALERGVRLEQTDWWSRTAWLIALLVGDIAKAQMLLVHGARPDACGNCGSPPLFHAIAGHHPDMVRWLLDGGADIEQTDDFGSTALMEAVTQDDLECVEILLDAGADIDRDANGTALNQARTREIVRRLLDAGAEPEQLSHEGRRAVIGFPPYPDEALIIASADDFQRARTRSFGRSNPERMDEPFWISMIRSGVSGYTAGQRFNHSSFDSGEPVWCAERFGQSMTFLPDGRIVQIAGEHEDSYDPDFGIYNDVIVHEPDGSIAIYGYPQSMFPPTDFHTATLIGHSIYVIGSLGYWGTRSYGTTPVYKLDVRTFRIECLHPIGDSPGWIYKHRAKQDGAREIRIWGGQVVTKSGDDESHCPNPDAFVLDIEQLTWHQVAN